MTKRTFLLPIATTLTALLGSTYPSAASAPAGDMVSTAGLSEYSESVVANNAVTLQRPAKSIADLAIGERLAYHYSHASHASHESHSSHYSGY